MTGDVIVEIYEEMGVKQLFIRDEIVKELGLQSVQDVGIRHADNPDGIFIFSAEKVEEWIEILEQQKGNK